ncbi:alpha beta hydrolase [Chlorella sorokiniana]|uniref:Alpha beta hydrolase n=1 Tax=Chlorella sorokiniana TaxID=3076 RepID=A0A2P6TNL7_CHLSO|nr:alpha beta hydrolase [Chlorella sorokiniana]|eukprot:PRW50931.1 alpha beta hydrolase [Chlorella sorokiniana]
MGGMIAQTIAVNHPSAVRAVASVASSFGGQSAPQPPSGIDAILKLLTGDAVDPSLMFPLGGADPAICSFLHDAFSLYYAGIPGYMNAPGSGYGAGTIIPSPLAAVVTAEAKAKQAAAVIQLFKGQGTLARLAKTPHPLLCMGGRKDRLIPDATQAQGHAATPGSWLLPVPDAGHAVPYQHPKQWANQVIMFLNGAQPVRAAAGAGAAAAAAAQTSESSSWRERFKTRYVEEARKQRLKRQARRLKAESTLQVLRLDVHRLEQALVQEQRQLPQLQAQLAALQKARQQASAAALAQVYWQPVAVQQAHGQGVAAVQQPLDAEGAEQDLQQRVAVSQLEVRKLTAALQAARRRAGEAQRKLQALLP